MTASAYHELLLFVIGVSTILVACRMIRQTLADMARDSIFALRDRVRAEFAVRELLGSEAYREARALLNGYLANLEEVNFASIITIALAIPRNYRRQTELPMVEGDDELNSFLRGVFARANMSTIKYVFFSGILLVPAAIPLILLLESRRKAHGLAPSSEMVEVEERPIITSIGGIDRAKYPIANVVQEWAQTSATHELAACAA